MRERLRRRGATPPAAISCARPSSSVDEIPNERKPRGVLVALSLGTAPLGMNDAIDSHEVFVWAGRAGR